ncbi:MAG TPA: M3 family metallopeptidase [Hyphomicrobiaceae bacterium]|nr:M3 family metallopeptidase [Hyphomicrobiaceae bacterium]
MATKAASTRKRRLAGTAGQRQPRRQAARTAAKASVRRRRRQLASNPLLAAWTAPFELPPFDRIRSEHFGPAFDRALIENRAEIAAVAGQRAQPTFANTIVALEQSGRRLDRIGAVFFNLSGADTSPEIQEIERKLAPKLARHSMGIYQDGKLFRRVDRLMRRRKRLDLNQEQLRVLEAYHRAFIKAGAGLRAPARRRLAAIAEQLAKLATRFNQNVLADEQSFLMLLEERDLDGLPPSLRSAAAELAKARGLPGKYAVSLSRSSVEPFLQFSARRDLREKAFQAWISRGANGGKTDNRKLIAEILALRAERARLLGFNSAAAATLDASMAKTPTAVRELLMQVWRPAVTRALEERDALQATITAAGGNFELAAWDWRYYAEKVRKAKFDVDEAAIKPYLQLENIIAAAFAVAQRLFGIVASERKDLRLYHADARAFEIKDAGGRHLGLFVGDYYARPSKRSGAWMSGWRSQHRLDGDVRPLVVNVMNFTKGAPGEPTLISLDDARTLFHEFGHALHGLLSDVTYPRVSGTRVERDFVELPSQLYEHWLLEPTVLRQFARHHQTGKPMPAALVKRLQAARTFNQGFQSVEYLAAAIVDLDLHVLKHGKGLDVDRFERQTLAGLGMPEEIVMRHRIPHFQHIIGGYAAGYYSYIWSEVMDADAFQAFEETGDAFDRETARRLYETIYSAGGRRDPADAYMAFRGRAPTTDALLLKRGLTPAPA